MNARKGTRRLVLVLSIACGFCGGLNGQTQTGDPKISLELGSVTVWLGMQETDALSGFQRAGYKIGPGSTEVSKILVNGSTIYGVWFKKGRLTFAERDWLQGRDVMTAVINGLASLQTQGANNCSIIHQPNIKPGVSIDTIYIYCENRSVVLSNGNVNVDGKTYTELSVKERIGRAE